MAAAEPGKFATIERRFADGDVIELDFPMETVFETLPSRRFVGKFEAPVPPNSFANASQGTVVTRGPLVFALPIAENRVEDKEEHSNMNGKKSGNPDFKCWNLRPASPFNYALAAHRAELVETSDESQDGFYGRVASVRLRVPVRRIEWELFEDRYTPDMPEKPVLLPGEEETVELVPYGTTMLRLSVFPESP